MADIFYQPKSRMFSNDGAIGSGYKFYFYQTGTTTPITTYSNVGLSVANTNPVVADSYGYFNLIYVSDFSQVKVIVKDSNDNLIYTADPVNPSGSSSITLNDLGVRPTSYWGLTAGTASAYTLAANPTLPAYSNYNTFFIQFNVACNAAPTLNVDSLGTKNLKKYTGQGSKVALQAGDVQASERYIGAYDGVDFIILNPRNTNIYTGTAPTLTIATGVITITNGGASYTVDTEGSAATDDLDTISGGATGEIIILGTANSSRDVVLKNGTGNIVNPSGIDVTLGTTNDQAVLKYNGSNWILIALNASGSTPIQLLQTQTASSSTQLRFTTQINSTFSKYEFLLKNILPSVSGTMLTVQYSVDGGSTWINSSYLQANTWATSSDAPAGATNKTTGLSLTGSDANSQTCSNATSSDGGINGKFVLYNPSSTTNHQASWETFFRTNTNNYMARTYGSGIYTGSTTAINAIQFIMKTANTDTTNGNLVSGSIEMYGIV